MVVWLVSLYGSPKSQLILLIITNIVFLIYMVKVRPYLNNINLIFTILTTLTLIVLEVFYLYFFSVQNTMFASVESDSPLGGVMAVDQTGRVSVATPALPVPASW